MAQQYFEQEIETEQSIHQAAVKGAISGLMSRLEDLEKRHDEVHKTHFQRLNILRDNEDDIYKRLSVLENVSVSGGIKLKDVPQYQKPQQQAALEGHLPCSRTINTQTGQSEIYKHCPPCPDAGYSGQATPTVKIHINDLPYSIVPGSYTLPQILALCNLPNYPELYWCSPRTIPVDLCHPDRKYLRVTYRTQINISGGEHFMSICPASKIYEEIEEAKLILENGAVPFEPVQGHTRRADGVIPTTTIEPFLPIEQSVKSFDPINTILTRLDRLENRATVLEKLEKELEDLSKLVDRHSGELKAAAATCHANEKTLFRRLNGHEAALEMITTWRKDREAVESEERYTQSEQT